MLTYGVLQHAEQVLDRSRALLPLFFLKKERVSHESLEEALAPPVVTRQSGFLVDLRIQ